MEEFRFKSVLKESLGKTLQLSFAPNLAMNHRILAFTETKAEERSKHLMNITGKTILITGTNRGLGKALVEEALRRGAQRVYAGARVPMEHSDMRVTPLTLDITSTAQIQEAGSEKECGAK